MKSQTKILGLLLFCGFGFTNTASAQTVGCLTAHFSFYVSQTMTAPQPSDPTIQTVTVNQTVTLSGYSTTTCPQIMGTAQHWVEIGNTLVHGTTTISAPYTSPKNCPTCSFSAQSTATYSAYDDDLPIESEPTYSLECTVAGNFLDGPISYASKYFRLMKGASLPTGPGTNCKEGATSTICDIPVKNWCTDATPAIHDVTEVTARVNPTATWWTTYDICARVRADNTVPWICPTVSITVPYGTLGIPVGIPFALDHYDTAPPDGYTSCDDLYKP